MKKKDIFLIMLSAYIGLLTISNINLKENNEALNSEINNLNLSINTINSHISDIYSKMEVLSAPTHLLSSYNFEIKDKKIYITADITSPSKPSKVVVKYKDSTKDNWREKEMTTTEYPHYFTSIDFDPSKDYNFSLYFIEGNKVYPFKMDNYSFKALAKSSIVHSINLYYNPFNNSIGNDFYFSTNLRGDNSNLFNVVDLTYRIVYNGKLIKEYTTKDFDNRNNGASNTFLLSSTIPSKDINKDIDSSLLKGEFVAKDLAGNIFKGTSLNNDLDITLSDSNK